MSRLEHLKHAIANLNEHKDKMNERGRTLVQKAIYAIYTDCLELGEGHEAAQILQEDRI